MALAKLASSCRTTLSTELWYAPAEPQHWTQKDSRGSLLWNSGMAGERASRCKPVRQGRGLWGARGLHCGPFDGLLFFFVCLFFRERGREGEREGEKHQCVVVSHTPPTGDLACNPGTCPYWESNRRPFGSQAGTHSTEPHQPGVLCFVLFLKTAGLQVA